MMIDPIAIPEDEDEQRDMLIDALDSMPDEDRFRFLRLFKRLAKMPKDYPLTPEIVTAMVENDTDIPLH